MNPSPRIVSVEISKSAYKRLKYLSESSLPQFEFLNLFSRALGERDRSAGSKTSNFAAKTLTAVAIGAETFNAIQALGLIVDDDVMVDVVKARQDAQAGRLLDYISTHAPVLGLSLPPRLDRYCATIIDLWQPTMINPNHFPEMLAKVDEAMEDHSIGQLFFDTHATFNRLSAADERPENKLLMLGLALVVRLNGQLFGAIPEEQLLFDIKRLIGLHAVDLANSGEPAKCDRAALILEVLWHDGFLQAGIDLARMYDDLLSPLRQSSSYARLVMDEVLDHYMRNPTGSFTDPDSATLMFAFHAHLQVEGILEDAGNGQQMLRFTVDLLKGLMCAVSQKIEGASLAAISFLDPGKADPSDDHAAYYVAARRVVSQYPKAEAYCIATNELALTAHSRRHG